MATNDYTKLEDLTTCTICLDTFTRPKVLPCQHSYCYACLMLLGKDKGTTITCPYCQKEHQIPTSGISGFNDNLLLKELVGISLPKTEVCTDCEKKPSVPDECDHCGRKVCQKCLIEHDRLSTELSNSLRQLKEYFNNPTSEDTKNRIGTFKTNLESERRKLREKFRLAAMDKLREVKRLLERLEFMDEVMGIIGQLYTILSSEDEESKSDSLISELLEKIRDCTTVDTMKDLKNNISDVKTLLILIKTNDEEFRFEYSTSMLDRDSQVEFGQGVVNIRGKYRIENIGDKIIQLVQDSGETLMKHVTREEIETETDERFFDNEKTKRTIYSKFSGNNNKSSLHEENLSSASVPLTPSDVQIYRQNELPRHVDYTTKFNGSPVVIRQEESDEDNKLQYPQGCAYHLERDEIFVADTMNHRVMSYSADGENARVFYTAVQYPQDVAVSSDGKYVYIAAYDSLIKAHIDGHHASTIDKFSLGDLLSCWSVTCHHEFTVAVDYGHQCVFVLNDRDVEIRCFGNEHLVKPQSVAVSDDGQIFVGDEHDGCVKVFDWRGQYKGTLTLAGPGSELDMWGIGVDCDGNICLSRPTTERIDVYNPQRELMASFNELGDKAGKPTAPCGLCFTPHGKLIVVDYNNHLIQIF